MQEKKTHRWRCAGPSHVKVRGRFAAVPWSAPSQHVQVFVLHIRQVRALVYNLAIMPAALRLLPPLPPAAGTPACAPASRHGCTPRRKSALRGSRCPCMT